MSNSATITQIALLAILSSISGYFVAVVASIGALGLTAAAWLIVGGVLVFRFGDTQKVLFEIVAPALIGFFVGALIALGGIAH